MPEPAVTAAPAASMPEPAFADPSLFGDTGFSPEPVEEPAAEPIGVAHVDDPHFGETPAPSPAPGEQAPAPDTPAWLAYVQERERAFQERESEWTSPGPIAPAEPAPTFIEDEEVQPVQAFQPVQPAVPADSAWALPDDQGAPAVGDEEMAFPPAPQVPVPEPEPMPQVMPDPVPVDVTPPALDEPPRLEPLQWEPADDLYRAPPDATGQEELQAELATPAPEVDDEEREERRRQQEEAARAYEQAREDDNRPPLS
ncbi:MAG: hypothetical protein JO086_10425 [Acidimicrobiia bacterium]|nr:hypothetical protein [Acidimicrobiia bacterium]